MSIFPNPCASEIRIAGGDTATPLNLLKRVALLETAVGLKGRRVLDAGCGAGEYVEAFATKGAFAEGVEFCADKVAQYQRRHPGSKRISQGNLEAVAFPDDSFDLIVLNEVLEHTPDEGRVLAEMRRVLRPDGWLAVFCPNRLYPFETHGVSWRKTGRALSPWLFGVPYLPLAIGRRWLVYPARNYWPGELARLVTAADFHLVKRHWLWQTFENISHHQPRWLALVRPQLRRIANRCEQIPIVCRLGVSQVIFAQKNPAPNVPGQ
ncbi:MAG: class I SAM-dependent methyltransferase [Opitutae bacterium]|nr:class I SAM-dependent methyltransferase [Opitutae bacterium]